MTYKQAIKKLKNVVGTESCAFVEVRHTAYRDETTTVSYRVSIVWDSARCCVGCDGATLAAAVAECIAEYHATVAVVGDGT